MSRKAAAVKERHSVEKEEMNSSGVVSSAAVTREVRIDSFSGLRQVVIAEGVNGAVIASKDNFVTCALKAVAAAFRRIRGEGASWYVGGRSTGASGASDDAKRSHKTMDVLRVAVRDSVGEGILSVIAETKTPS